MNQVVVKGLSQKVERRATAGGTPVVEATLVSRLPKGGFSRTRVKALGQTAEGLGRILQEGQAYLALGVLSPGHKGEAEVLVYRAVPLEGAQVGQNEHGSYLEGGENRVLVGGYLGTDPEVRVVELGNGEGRILTLARLAVRSGERTAWVTLKAWGEELADQIGQLRKGEYLAVEGRYTLRKGKDQYRPQILVERVLGGGGLKEKGGKPREEGGAQEAEDLWF